MKRFVFLLLTSLFLLPAVSLKAQKPFKMAYFDLDSLLDIMPEMLRATDDAAAYYRTLEDQMYKMQNQLDSMQMEYDKTRANLPADQRTIKEQSIHDLQQNIEIFRQQAQEDYENYRKKLVEPIYNKIKEAAKAVAKEKGYAFVLDSSESMSVVLYSDQAYDIFDDMRIKLGIPALKK